MHLQLRLQQSNDTESRITRTVGTWKLWSMGRSHSRYITSGITACGFRACA